MPDIVPTNTEVLVCAGVPLDNKYNDTILFTSAGAQQGYFKEKAKYSYNGNFTYQRVQNKVNNYSSLQSLPNPRIEFSCRIPVNADKVYDCNYLCFCNHYDTNKWWYCFIKEINYISPNCCEIIYEIDAIQTFLFDFHVQKSFVEREHTATDDLFEYVCLEDDIAKGEYVLETIEELNVAHDTNTWKMVVFALSADSKKFADLCNLTLLNISSVDFEEIEVGDETYECPTHITMTNPFTDKYIGLAIAVTANGEDVLAFTNCLNAIGKGGEILSILSYRQPAPAELTMEYEDKSVSISLDSYNGLEIYNKMLFNYPFRKFEILSTDGGKYELRPNLFKDQIKFSIYKYNSGSSIKFGVKPQNYEYAPNAHKPTGQYNLHGENISKTLIANCSIQCAWTNDAYQTWLAQNQGSLSAQRMSGLINTIAGIAMMAVGITGIGATGGASSTATIIGAQNAGQGIRDLAQASGRVKDAKHLPDTAHGCIDDTDFAFGVCEQGIWFYSYRLDDKSMKRIDNYFERYGYKVNEIKIPTPFEGHQRPKFNYVKTADVNITGNVPTPQMNIIKSAFDNGITFWHNPRAVGIYEEGENDV